MLFFGPVVPDGYGFCYNPQETKILFGVSSFKSNQITVEAEQMADLIQQSLCDMQEVMASAVKSNLWAVENILTDFFWNEAFRVRKFSQGT